ncbi:MAG: hypothetical protein KDA68_23805 [Planctomycetaceae bacterium]|nr:hypothetical protein [Planctomycetaceae bacterium]
MARNEADREDLLEEAIGLSPCWEIEVIGLVEPLVAGFKKNGNCSLYFGGDPVYQFDPEGHLRRGFVGGHLFRSEGKTLSQIHRDRTETTSTLVRYDLNEVELQEWLAKMRKTVAELIDRFDRGEYRILRERGTDAAAFTRLTDSLQQIHNNSPKLSAPLR